MESSNSLPYDIVDVILSKLPVKSLLRFKCVSKSWRCTISNPKFTLSNPKQKGIIMMSHGKAETSSNLICGCPFSIDEEALIDEIIPLPWIGIGMPRQWNSIFVAGSCNGLLLVFFGGAFFLWNPSTREFIKVLKLNEWFHVDFVRLAYGLCYDSVTDDYKVVVMIGENSPGYGGYHVIVASLKTKQRNDIRDKFPYDIGSAKEGPVVSGRLHWRVKDSDDGWFCTELHKIVYFDSLTEEFKELPIPKSEGSDIKVIIGLGVLGGCLCMVRCDSSLDCGLYKGYIEVLAMKEYGVKKSWTTLFTISNLKVSPYYRGLMPLFLTNKGEVMMIKDNNEILAYNPKEKSYRELRIQKIKRFHNGAATFMESLVSPPRYPLEKEVTPKI